MTCSHIFCLYDDLRNDIDTQAITYNNSYDYREQSYS